MASKKEQGMSLRTRPALGRGLGSLIPKESPEEVADLGAESSKILEIPIGDIEPSHIQPRTHFEESAIVELAQSIERHGLLQPILVRKIGKGQYEIVAGERRWRAAKMAGLGKVSSFVLDLADKEALTIALVENLQRQDLNAIEEAQAFLRLSEELHMTQEDIAQAVGKDRATIANALRLLRLPRDIQQMVVDQAFSMGHARALLGLENEELMSQVAKKIVREGLSVRKTEALIRAINGSGVLNLAQKEKPSARETPESKYVRRALEEHLGTRVFLQQKKEAGKIIIHYSCKEQLAEILSKLAVEL